MAEKNFKVRNSNAYYTEAQWAAKDPVLKKGEVGYISDNRGKFKIGDGTTKWSQLSYYVDSPSITVDSALSSTSTNPVQNKVINTALGNKANASDIPTKTSDLTNDTNFITDSGYVHTDNNYTTTEKNKLSGIDTGANKTTVDSALSDTSENPLQNKVINSALSNKVDKVSGKGLSSNDFTTTEKNKLAGIASGAEVNVQSDWSVTDTTSDAYIKNKPSTFTPASHTHAATDIDSGTLSVSRGGTGRNTLSSGYALIGNGTSAVSLRNITNSTSTSYISPTTNLITANTLAHWNGRYSSGSSSLQYCDRGRFGTVVTKNDGDYLPQTTITTTTDLNTLTSTGVYHFNIAPGGNAPSTAWGTLYVDFNIGTPYQIYIPDGTGSQIYKRAYMNNSWTGWSEINPNLSNYVPYTATDYLFPDKGLNGVNIDDLNQSYTVGISESGHGTIPMSWQTVANLRGGHFLAQIALSCNPRSSTSGYSDMYIRDRYFGSDYWCNWTRVFTNGNCTVELDTTGTSNNGGTFYNNVVKFPNGLCIQWGYHTKMPEAIGIHFKYAFSYEPSISFSHGGGHSSNKSYFIFLDDDGSHSSYGSRVEWMAIGYIN